MGAFQRLGDIFSANINDMVDKFEDPQKMLQHAVREMETECSEATCVAAKALATEKLLSRKVSQQERDVAAWQQRAECAVQAGDDKLARKALTRKMDCESLVVSLRDDLVAAQSASETMRKQVDGMRSKYEEAKHKLAILVVRKQAANARCHQRPLGQPVCVLNTSAFDKFERMKDKVEMAEAQAEAMVELGQMEFASCTQSEPSGEDLAVEAELAALKASLCK